ncbi:Inner membrane protein ypdA [Raoultella planticola]|uniref:Inner membrane protein ypdA n=1 Tax=Raoultella planticola TaxID=575 RepID=A0A485C5M3_RAOPL|nr:Inner membrane protein ypdA [Raoultella planticola]
MSLSRDRHGAPMHEIFTMLLAVFDRAALMLICLFFLIRLRLFRELLHKSAHTPKELLAVIAIFSLFALFSTWSGVPVEGSLVNVRIIAVMSGGFYLALGRSYRGGDCRRSSLSH